MCRIKTFSGQTTIILKIVYFLSFVDKDPGSLTLFLVQEKTLKRQLTFRKNELAYS